MQTGLTGMKLLQTGMITALTTTCHGDNIILVDGGWLAHWDEGLDESVKLLVNETIYLAALTMNLAVLLL